MRYKQINNPHDGSLLDVNDRVGIVICAVGRSKARSNLFGFLGEHYLAYHTKLGSSLFLAFRV